MISPCGKYITTKATRGGIVAPQKGKEMKLENWTMTEILNYYADYLVNECEIAANKAEAKKLFLNAITYNVVREAIVEQVAFLKEECEV